MVVRDLACGDDKNMPFTVCMYVAAGIGALFILIWLFKAVALVLQFTCRCRQNLMRKYGSPDGNSWAVVTGGSNGIGLELCHQLAAQGFNICMVSRDIHRVTEKCLEVKSKHPNVETRAVGADLSAITSVQGYRDLVAEHMEDLDIGILALNAGTMILGPSDLISDAQFEQVIGLNSLQVLYMTKALINKMYSREKRSAILIVSSGFARLGMPGLATYSATKALASTFGDSLYYEVRDRIDVTTWEPGPVLTNLVPGQSPPKAIAMTAQRAVSQMLCQLGRVRKTARTFFFSLQMMPPLGLVGNAAAKNSRRQFELRQVGGRLE